MGVESRKSADADTYIIFIPTVYFVIGSLAWCFHHLHQGTPLSAMVLIFMFKLPDVVSATLLFYILDTFGHLREGHPMNVVTVASIIIMMVNILAVAYYCNTLLWVSKDPLFVVFFGPTMMVMSAISLYFLRLHQADHSQARISE